ncbi:MAG: 30S ribosomal protein S4 [Flavobacteriales bacterium]|nr:MAG: 30S ribosomal protein S4 [Flavobacteriales bacterium]
MARYRGPKSKIARKFKEPIFGPDKTLERKSHPSGSKGASRRRTKQSEYAVQLQEKQKAKYTYGILEKQFRKMFSEASRKKGITGENLLQLCETRLDNTVYRMGIAPTRRGARQLVSHKHITVDGKVANVASYILRPGQEVAVRERSKALEAINNSLNENISKYPWLDFNSTEMKGKLIAMPEREQIPENIKEQLIVELYSK